MRASTMRADRREVIAVAIRNPVTEEETDRLLQCLFTQPFVTCD